MAPPGSDGLPWNGALDDLQDALADAEASGGRVSEIRVAAGVYRLCGQCGLGADEIGRLIDTTRHATLTPEQNLDLFYATFEDRSEAEPCEPCAEAVLDAAGR